MKSIDSVMGRKNRRYKKDRRYLFVDGYNIINQWENLTPLIDKDLELAREKLIESLLEFSHVQDLDIILVFDAYKVKGNQGTSFKKDNLEVVYTKELETADHYIEKELDHIGRVREVTVATSDYIEQQIILARGGSRISARELEVMVKNSQSLVRLEAKKIKKTTKSIKNTLKEETLKELEDIKKSLE